MATNLLEARIHNKIRTGIAAFLYRYNHIIQDRYGAEVVIDDDPQKLMIEHKNGIEVILPYIIEGDLRHDYVVDQFTAIREIRLNVNSFMKIALIRGEDPLGTASRILKILGDSLSQGIYHQPLAVQNAWKQYELVVVHPNRI